MLILMEGIVLCFILLMFCVIGIANGPEKIYCVLRKEGSRKSNKIRIYYSKRNKETNHYINYSFILALFYSCAIDGLLYKWCQESLEIFLFKVY